METLTPEKFSCPFWNLLDKFFFQNAVYKLQEDFSELGIKVFLENGLTYFTDLRQTGGD
jgi:hypothetical protein